jgi:peptidyl-tRNA hydrolase
MIKLYCVFAKESIAKMKGNRGKLASQAGHAYLHTVWDAMNRFPQLVIDYQNSERAYKITLVVDTVAELEQLRDAYAGVCGVSLVKDAGFTVFDEPTVTCLGIGPIHVDQIGDDLKQLKLLI